MSYKTTQINVFMTKADEATLSAQVKALYPRVVFMDIANLSTSAAPTLQEGIESCKGTIVLLLNEDILTFDEYCQKWITPHLSGTGYSSSVTVSGIIQISRARIPQYDQNGLESANISAGFTTEDEAVTLFVKSIMQMLKKEGKKVYDINPETNQAFGISAPFYLSYPDAAKLFDGTDGHYLRPDAINRMIAK